MGLSKMTFVNFILPAFITWLKIIINECRLVVTTSNSDENTHFARLLRSELLKSHSNAHLCMHWIPTGHHKVKSWTIQVFQLCLSPRSTTFLQKLNFWMLWITTLILLMPIFWSVSFYDTLYPSHLSMLRPTNFFMWISLCEFLYVNFFMWSFCC